MLSLGTSLTNQNAAAVLRDGLARVAQGEVQVDCTGLAQVDSSAVAVLLAWNRAAAARSQALSLRGVPPQLSQLASLYGVDGLLGLAPRPHRKGTTTDIDPASPVASTAAARDAAATALRGRRAPGGGSSGTLPASPIIPGCSPIPPPVTGSCHAGPGSSGTQLLPNSRRPAPKKPDPPQTIGHESH